MKTLPYEPTEDMWNGTARQLVKYMQMNDRYCPASLKKHFDRFIGDIPEWLNAEVNDWTSEHAFATADLGVFIYKAMYHEFKASEETLKSCVVVPTEPSYKQLDALKNSCELFRKIGVSDLEAHGAYKAMIKA